MEVQKTNQANIKTENNCKRAPGTVCAHLESNHTISNQINIF